MFRLIGFLIMFSLSAGGYMFFDYKMASRWANPEDRDGLTFAEYLGGLSGRLSGLGSPAAAAGLPAKLADMMPVAPEGWTVRPTVPEDVEGFLPKGKKKADKAALAYIKEMAAEAKGRGVDTAALTYEKGDRKVLIRAVRYPNIIFTSFMAMQQRFELQMRTAAFRGTEFMTVRGLDVTEDLLPDDFRGRLFFADVGAQIHIRVLAPERMADRDLVPFFQTLHVKAMNASVVEKREGLGDVPVIVLASELDAAERDAYVATLAEREATKARDSEAALQEAETQAAADAAAEAESGGLFDGLFGGGDDPPDGETADAAAEAGGKAIECEKGKNGVKRCKVVAKE